MTDVDYDRLTTIGKITVHG